MEIHVHQRGCVYSGLGVACSGGAGYLAAEHDLRVCKKSNVDLVCARRAFDVEHSTSVMSCEIMTWFAEHMSWVMCYMAGPSGATNIFQVAWVCDVRNTIGSY